MRKTSKKNIEVKRFWVEKRVEKSPSRPRRGRCGESRGRAVVPAARLGSDDGSAAGAHGQGAAGSPAAAPGGRTLPGQRLPSVVPPLREICRTPRHAAARPVGLCHGARRGEGGARPGKYVLRLVPEGTLRLAAAAVPRLAGTVPLRGGTRRSGPSCSHGRISIPQQPFFSLIVFIICFLDASFMLLRQVHV